VSSRRPAPQGRFPVPSVADLAALALRRAYERVEAGDAAVSLRNAVAAMRLAWQIERAEAMLGAVRQARERANRAHADQVSVGGPVFAFLLPPARPAD
jgi:hypothetical protein